MTSDQRRAAALCLLRLALSQGGGKSHNAWARKDTQAAKESQIAQALAGWQPVTSAAPRGRLDLAEDLALYESILAGTECLDWEDCDLAESELALD